MVGELEGFGCSQNRQIKAIRLLATSSTALWVFKPFGTVELVQLPFDDTGHCKGFGFVQFARLEDARNALNLNGQLEIAGRAIKVSAVTDQIKLDIGTNAGDFDDDEGGGLSLNVRALLMQKLDRSGSATIIPSSLGTAANNITGIALPLPPVLGAPTSVSSLVPSIVPGSMPILPGQLFLLFDKQE